MALSILACSRPAFVAAVRTILPTALWPQGLPGLKTAGMPEVVWKWSGRMRRCLSVKGYRKMRPSAERWNEGGERKRMSGVERSGCGGDVIILKMYY